VATVPEIPELPWRAADLEGAHSNSGPTYDGGMWTGSSRTLKKSVAVRCWTPMGRPATVELDLTDTDHGCTVTLPPALARQAAAALIVAAERAESEMRKWQDVLDRQREEIDAAAQRDLVARAGVCGHV
jgi:hypothetical protein